MNDLITAAMNEDTREPYSKLIANQPTLTFSAPPKPVGFWVLYPGNAFQTRFSMFVRPTDEQIKNTEALLGWGWEET